MIAGDVVRALVRLADAVGDPAAVLLLAVAVPYVWVHRAGFRTGRVTRTGVLLLTATGSAWAARTGQHLLALLVLTTGVVLLLTTLTDRPKTESAS